jgi:AMP-binding enzyme
MIDWLGPVIWEQYGSTETGVVALCDTAEWLAHPGTVGRPFLSSEIRIFSTSGAPCPPGTPGEIYARMHGTPDFSYLGRPEARAVVEREGLISAGDIGELDADGYLHLRDCRQDLILSGGNNVYPAEIEARLAEPPEVSDCAVFGVPDEEFGQRAASRGPATSNSAPWRDRAADGRPRRVLCRVRLPGRKRSSRPTAAPGPSIRRSLPGSPRRRGDPGCGTCSALRTRRAWWSATPRPRTSPRSWGAARSSGRWRCTA